jgi:hypothetical protein
VQREILHKNGAKRERAFHGYLTDFFRPAEPEAALNGKNLTMITCPFRRLRCRNIRRPDRFFFFSSGVAIYAGAQSAIHQIYAALLMITSVLGLVILAIGIGAATIRAVILNGQQQASSERRMLADALLAVAENRRAA